MICNIDNTDIEYEGILVSVPKEVADFLEQDRRRMAAQERRDRRRLSRSRFEQLPFYRFGLRETEETATRNLRLENLRKAVSKLEPRDRELIRLRYNDEMTMEDIGHRQGVSKMAVSKRLKRVHNLLGRSVW